MAVEDDVRLRLSLQRAMLTHVTSELRSVSADVTPEARLIRVRFIFAREPSDSERDAASCAATEVIADYPDGWRVDEEYCVSPTGEAMSHLRLLVYHRCEDEWVSPDA
jgi:hypothetical protein